MERRFEKEVGRNYRRRMAQISGDKDNLIGILQQKYGRSKEQAQREVDDFWREQERKTA